MGDAAAEEDKGGDDIFAEEPDLGDSEILQSSKELHTYLGNLEALDLRADYELKVRKWRFSIGEIFFTNQGESKSHFFVSFVLTDDRPPSGFAPKALNSMFGGTPATLKEFNNVTRYTPVIRNVFPQQRVGYPGELRFRDWGTSAYTISMTYKDILQKALRVEVWSYNDLGANVLMGSVTMRLSAIVHQRPDHSLDILRTTVSTKPGHTQSVGTLEFTTTLEEAKLQHQLVFRHWGIALSNVLGSSYFKHPCNSGCTCPCCIATCCCCASPMCGSLEDLLQSFGFGESIQVYFSAPSAIVAKGEKDTGKKAIMMAAPLHTASMHAAVKTPDSVIFKDTGRPVNNSATFAKLFRSKEDETLSINCSRSALEDVNLTVDVDFVCRRCYSKGAGKAIIPLRGVTNYSFLPVSAPIVFKRVPNESCFGCCDVCTVGVTAGVIRGFLMWRIEGAPLAHHFAQPGGKVGGGEAEEGMFSSKPPALCITVKEVKGLPPVHSDGSVDPRVTITWAGNTQTTKSAINSGAVEYNAKLRFPMPVLPGYDPTGARADAAALRPALEVYRYALIRVWDDVSFCSLEKAGGISRFTRRTELVAESLVELPMRRLLGLDDPTASGVEAVESGAKGCCKPKKKAPMKLPGQDTGPYVPYLETEHRLVIPGAPTDAPAPVLQLAIELEGMPLVNGLSKMCLPVMPKDHSINLLPDFAQQVHRDAAAGSTASTITMHVSAPGDRLQSSDSALVGQTRAKAREMAAYMGMSPAEAQSKTFKASMWEGGPDPMHRMPFPPSVRSLFRDGKTTKPVQVVQNTMPLALSIAPDIARELIIGMSSGKPGALSPVLDMTHVQWWSLLLRMAVISNPIKGQSEAVWMRYMTHASRKRAMMDRLGVVAKAAAEAGLHELCSKEGTEPSEEAISAAHMIAYTTAAQHPEFEPEPPKPSFFAKLLGKGPELPDRYNDRDPTDIMRNHVSPLLYFTDEDGVRRALPSLIQPLPSEPILRNFGEDNAKVDEALGEEVAPTTANQDNDDDEDEETKKKAIDAMVDTLLPLHAQYQKLLERKRIREERDGPDEDYADEDAAPKSVMAMLRGQDERQRDAQLERKIRDELKAKAKKRIDDQKLDSKRERGKRLVDAFRPPGSFKGVDDPEDVQLHLAARATALASSIEFCDSASLVRRIRQQRGLLADESVLEHIKAHSFVRSTVDQATVAAAAAVAAAASKMGIEVISDKANPSPDDFQRDARRAMVQEFTQNFVAKTFADPDRHFADVLLSTLQTDAVLSPSAFLSLRRGGALEHAAFLCSLLLGIGMDAYLCIGTIEAHNSDLRGNANQVFDRLVESHREEKKLAKKKAKEAAAAAGGDAAAAAVGPDGAPPPGVTPAAVTPVAPPAATSPAAGTSAPAAGGDAAAAPGAEDAPADGGAAEEELSEDEVDATTMRAKEEGISFTRSRFPKPRHLHVELKRSRLLPVDDAYAAHHVRAGSGGSGGAASGVPDKSSDERKLFIGPRPAGAGEAVVAAQAEAEAKAAAAAASALTPAAADGAKKGAAGSGGSEEDVGDPTNVTSASAGGSPGKDKKADGDPSKPSPPPATPVAATPATPASPAAAARPAAPPVGAGTGLLPLGGAGTGLVPPPPTSPAAPAATSPAAGPPVPQTPANVLAAAAAAAASAGEDSESDSDDEDEDGADPAEDGYKAREARLKAQQTAALEIMRETLHYYVIAFTPGRKPGGKLQKGEEGMKFTAYDIDGSITSLEQGGGPVSSVTNVKYMRVLAMANNVNVWVNNQVTYEEPPMEMPRPGFKVAPATSEGLLGERILEGFCRPMLMSHEKFGWDFMDRSKWLVLVPEQGKASAGGANAKAITAPHDALINNHHSPAVQKHPVADTTGPGLGPLFLTYRRDTGGQKFFPGSGLDGSVVAPPAPLTPLIKILLGDMERKMLADDISNELHDAIVNMRTSLRILAGVVSDQKAFQPVVLRLRKLLTAHAALDMYNGTGNRSAIQYQDARFAFFARANELKAMVPPSVDASDAGMFTVAPAAGAAGAASAGGAQTLATSSKPGSTLAAAGAVVGKSLQCKIRIYKINGASRRRVVRTVLKDTQFLVKPLAEIALAAMVQQPISGVFVTRVAVMTVFPFDGA